MQANPGRDGRRNRAAATLKSPQAFAGSGVPQGTLRQAARVYSRAIEEVNRDCLLEEVDRSRAVEDYAQRGLECLKRSTRTVTPDSAAATLFDFADVDADPALKGLRTTDQYLTWRKSQSLMGP